MLLPRIKAPESGVEGVARTGPGDGDAETEGPGAMDDVIDAGGDAGNSGVDAGAAGAGGELTDGPGLVEVTGGEDAGAGEMVGAMLGAGEFGNGMATVGAGAMEVVGGTDIGIGGSDGACAAERLTMARDKQSMSMALETAMTP